MYDHYKNDLVLQLTIFHYFIQELSNQKVENGDEVMPSIRIFHGTLTLLISIFNLVLYNAYYSSCKFDKFNLCPKYAQTSVILLY